MTRSQINFFDEMIADNFAGGGGASTGIELATGRIVDIAINHDPDAILMHKTNHPYTKHYQASVWDVDPVEVCGGRPVGLAWFSPDCKHFSKAKGGKPVDKNIRGLAWIVLRWAGTVRPRVIILENVEEFQTWGPVRRGRPMKSKTGQTFHKFVSQLEALGYIVEWRELAAADYGAPTTRKRFFLIARCDGRPAARERFHRQVYYEARATDVPGWDAKVTLPFEEMQIALRTRFQETTDMPYLQKLLSDISTGAKVTFNDNSVATTIVTKKGIDLQANETIRPIVTLRPYRTFQEVAQPESIFLIRINERGISFIEADGGMWKLKARETVKAFLEEQLEKEVSAGSVIAAL